ncbi:ADP-ribosylglycohydrolase family protein [Chrysiogenes arsenatis]|uniref:ADP-ribosylglycohydrolase family protein n=1 Tax=Chrysiogenes arsenatis TaxID=309797 RepID=UPI000422C2DE|nr:ADP-ribosylglycohydrolase family protein [Chrysiogenes arsenatis]
MNEVIAKRALGAALAYAAGDAFGATTEFMTPAEIKDRYGVRRKMIGEGWLRLRPGQVTDDTQMCIYLARSILRSKGFCPVGVADGFVEWMRSKPVDIGSTVRAGIRRYITEKKVLAEPSEWAGGNGSAMRILPLVVYCLKSWHLFPAMALGQGRITHHNRDADLIMLALGECLKVAIETGDKMAVLDVASAFIRRYPAYSFSRYKGECSGYIVDTFKCVMHYFFDETSLENIIIGTASQGGDADTTSAIAGMLAGAIYGVDAIPRQWQRTLDSDVQRTLTGHMYELLQLPCCWVEAQWEAQCNAEWFALEQAEGTLYDGL